MTTHLIVVLLVLIGGLIVLCAAIARAQAVIRNPMPTLCAATALLGPPTVREDRAHGDGAVADAALAWPDGQTACLARECSVLGQSDVSAHES